MNISKEKDHRSFDGFYRAYVANNGYDEEGELQTDDLEPPRPGMIQVRILGVHTQNSDDTEDGIPDENLPWAEQAQSLFGSYGETKEGISKVPETGSWVWIFFDNGNYNKPVYFASIPGKEDLDEDMNGVTSIIKTLSGHKITISDKEDEQYIKVETQGGNIFLLDDTKDEEKISFETTNEIKFNLDDKNKLIELFTSDGKGIMVDEENKKVIINDNSDNTITMSDDGIEIKDGNTVITMDGSEVVIENSSNTITLKSSEVDINGNFTVSS